MLADAKSSKFQVIVLLESQGIRCLSNGIQGQAEAVVVRAVRRFVRVQPDPGPTRFSRLWDGHPARRQRKARYTETRRHGIIAT